MSQFLSFRLHKLGTQLGKRRKLLPRLPRRLAVRTEQLSLGCRSPSRVQRGSQVKKQELGLLERSQRNGAFRRDANAVASGQDDVAEHYLTLNEVEPRAPPLRQLVDHVLLADAALRMKRKIARLAPDAADQLLRYEWPGNVRELENAMERAVALARGSRVELKDLPEEIRKAFPIPVATTGTVRPLDEIEKEYILVALGLNGGNQTHTATQLRIGSATLYRKLKSYGLIGGKRAVRKGNRRRHSN